MDLTKASKKYQEYCQADKHQSENNKEEAHVSCNYMLCYDLGKKGQMSNLKLLVTCQEVSGRF